MNNLSIKIMDTKLTIEAQNNKDCVNNNYISPTVYEFLHPLTGLYLFYED
jgi:hypothetical protein